jgi:3-deoxy-D-manno-octulosonic-acid transferase
MFKLIYKCVFLFIRLAMPLLKRKYPKLKEREQYAADTFTSIQELRNSYPNQTLFWIHAASTGEFEQAKPVIEQLKVMYAECIVCVTFFSPSGYNAHKNYTFADCVCYLPLDTGNNANRFIETLAPVCAIFIRYDLWFNYLYILNKKAIPTFCICTTLSSSIPKNYFYTLYVRKVLELCTKVYTANKNEYEKIRQYYPSVAAENSSDTRFDRISSIVDHPKNLPLSKEDFPSQKPIIIVGSSWREDEHLFFQMYVSDKHQIPFSLIIVPHEPTHDHVHQLRTMFTSCVLWSEIENNADRYKSQALSIIIVDSIGKLLQIYSLADAAYIGGGFGAGVHSCAEPAGYGIPLCSGKKIDRSPDAIALKKEKALTLIENTQELRQWISIIVLNKEARLRRGFYAKNYINTRRGASSQITSDIQEIIAKHQPFTESAQ